MMIIQSDYVLKRVGPNLSLFVLPGFFEVSSLGCAFVLLLYGVARTPPRKRCFHRPITIVHSSGAKVIVLVCLIPSD